MPLYNLLFSLFSFVLFFCSTVLANSSPINFSPCPNVIFYSADKNGSLEFSDNEKKFICGDKNIPDWKGIPNYQKKIHIKAILQSRGYYLSKMEEKDSSLHIYLGAIKHIKKITYHGFIPEEELTNNTLPIGKKLTPNNLNQVETITKKYLKTKGYPCPSVRSEADPETEQVDVFVSLQEKFYFTPPKETHHPELLPQLFPRYYVFTKGNIFNQRLLSLTSQRVLKDGVLTFSQFSTKCSDSKNNVQSTFQPTTQLTHNTVLGKPRIFRIGVGFNSETGPFTSLRWTNTRLSSLASQLQSQLQASFVEQSISLSGKFFPLKSFKDSFLRPRIQLVHTNEDTFESLETELSLRLGNQWETAKNSILLTVGPAFTYTDLLRGSGLTSEGYLSLNLETSLWSHEFEFFAGSPQSGFELNFTATHTSPSLGSTFSATRLETHGRWLKNIAKYTPARLIVGTRFKLVTTIKGSDDQLTDLPIEFREFAGGSEDIRGFSRKSLPVDGNGLLTMAYLGLELRSNSLFSYGLQPLIFFDIAGLSQESTNITSPYYHSPGLGLRWDTPIGVFRFNYAKGYEFGSNSSTDSNDQFYLSYGEEF